MADNQKETWIGIDDRPDNESPLRHSEPNRLAVTGLLLELIRGLFGEDGTNIINPALANYYWVPELQGTLEEAKNQILVEEVFSWTPDKTGTRPAVLVRGNKWEDRRVTLGDKVHHMPELSGKEKYYKHVTGSHTVFVIGRTSAQTELFAREVYLYLNSFSPIILKETCFERWTVPVLDGVQELEEYEEHFVIPINLVYELSYSWKLFPVTRLLQGVLMNFETN
jgi:hypothetical protein